MAAGPHLKRLVFLVWLLIAVFYFFLSYRYIRASMADRQFGDYLQYVVQIAGNENRPSKEVRALILVRAQELSLPIRGEQISILGGGPTLDVSVDYIVDIDAPVVHSPIYSKRFEHRVKYQVGKTF
jgi:hypothetical protein